MLLSHITFITLKWTRQCQFSKIILFDNLLCLLICLHSMFKFFCMLHVACYWLLATGCFQNADQRRSAQINADSELSQKFLHTVPFPFGITHSGMSDSEGEKNSLNLCVKICVNLR